MLSIKTVILVTDPVLTSFWDFASFLFGFFGRQVLIFCYKHVNYFQSQHCRKLLLGKTGLKVE